MALGTLIRRLAIALLLPLGLAACGADHVYAPDDVVARAAYHSNEPPSITLFTVVRKLNGEGAHASLLINGSQRVLLDPAGTWHHPQVPERYDVFYGITPMMKNFYIDYHARETYDVVEQRVEVSPQVAELAIRRAEEHGSTPKAFCGSTVSSVLRGLPGFESIPQTFFPNRISKAFAQLPGVYTKVHHDGDPDDRHNVLLIQADQADPAG